ncbi:uncharacterized protein LOC134209810 [Armigeres subalbatus]|uniref:uncharacterized protein LOC134209810 n=1 Tax=Armigeres subalbatus TaxID=124917 RepID=UPI002ED3C54E
METEYKFIQTLQRNDLFVDAREFIISNQLQPSVVNNIQQMDNDPITGILMPIQFQLRKYLESPNVFQTIMSNLAPSTDGCIRSIVDGNLWKSRTAGMSPKIVVPINLFFDDFTTGDTVSPHASTTSVCGIYYYVPCLPGHILSKLVNIFVAGYVLSEDRKSHTNEELFTNLVNVLIELECDGLQITLDEQKLVVYFMVGSITGDNLGLAGILDLVESARANYYCRRCKRDRTQRETDTIEHPKSFRSIANYETDIELQDVSMTGVKKCSIFNRIPSFHIARNVYFDLMHDLWEGVCVYGLGHCLNYFVYKKKYFDLNQLNSRKNLFQFGNLHSSNIPNNLLDTNLSKNKIKMTASEIKTLVTFLPLIIGDKIPDQDEVWTYFCNLLKICHILMLREIPSSIVPLLREIIDLHHSQYQTLFGDTLKPKHHNLVHYPSFLEDSGTARHQWAMRGEAKHRDAKQYCRVNNNKINLCKSLGIKISYKFAHSVINELFIPPMIYLSKSKTILAQLTSEHRNLIQKSNIALNFSDSVKHLSSFVLCSTVFSKGTVFYLGQVNLIRMYEVENIILNDQNQLILICKKMIYSCFNKHLQSFEIIRTNELQALCNIEKMKTQAVNLHKLGSKLYYRCCNINVHIDNN